jgi:uncharacterized alpha-E superfamily protein
LKERLSSDTWRTLQQLESHFSSFAPANTDQRYAGGLEVLDNAVLTLSAFSGLLMENTTRGVGWRFLEIGRRMERAVQASELLRCSLDSAAADLEPYLHVLLHVADSSITYRRRHPTAVQADLVLDLLIVDETNPRSLAFQVASLLHQITRLQEASASSETSPEHDMMQKSLKSLRSASMAEISRRESDGTFKALDQLIENLKTNLWGLSDALTTRYFSNLTACRFTASW